MDWTMMVLMTETLTMVAAGFETAPSYVLEGAG